MSHRSESVQNLTKSTLKTIFKKSKNFKNEHLLKGEGLLSMLFYMAVLAVVTIGVISVYFNVRDTYRENQATVLLNQLVGSISKVYGTNRNYGNDANLVPVLEGFGALPDGARVDDGTSVTLEHPFGGAVTLVGGPGGVINRYAIAFTILDDNTCATMAGKYSTQSRGRSGIDTLDVNGTTLTRPVTPVAINSACGQGDGSNTVTWTYY